MAGYVVIILEQQLVWLKSVIRAVRVKNLSPMKICVRSVSYPTVILFIFLRASLFAIRLNKNTIVNSQQKHATQD